MKLLHRPLHIGALVGVAAMLLAACSAAGSGGDGGAPAGSLEVIVAASPEKATFLNELADEFNAAETKVGDKAVYVTIQKTSSGVGADLLVEDWPEADGSRRPTVWSPAASLWGEVVDARRGAAGKTAVVPDDFKPIMLTPVVIAMPQPMAEALGWPAAPIGWADIVALAQDPRGWAKFGHPEWGPFRLGKTNPNISTTGFNTTIAQAYAGAGKQRGLTTQDLVSEPVRVFLEAVESSVVHYGDTTLTFLENLQRADERGAATSYVSAVALEEKSVLDYNNGDPAGNLVPGESGNKPRTPLVAVYPSEGTLWSDNPFYILETDWVSQDHKDAAKLFEEFVVDRDQSQKRALEFGFRPADPNVAVGPPIDAANGLDPKQPQTVLPVPSGDVLLDVLSTWDATRKAARVLLVLDVSGSMGDTVADGQTKLDLAKSAVVDSLGQLNDADEVGLWVFSTELNGTQDWAELVGVAPLGDNRAEIDKAVSGLVPLQGTGLYDTAQAAVEFMTPLAQTDRITAVVLLTDGKNEDRTNSDLQGLVDRLDAEGSFTPVRVFAIAYGADASTSELTAITTAANGALYESTDPANITEVFRNVLSNF